MWSGGKLHLFINLYAYTMHAKALILISYSTSFSLLSQSHLAMAMAIFAAAIGATWCKVMAPPLFILFIIYYYYFANLKWKGRWDE